MNIILFIHIQTNIKIQVIYRKIIKNIFYAIFITTNILLYKKEMHIKI